MTRPKKKRPRGRPPVTDQPQMHQVSTWLPEPMLDKITEIRAGRLDRPDRSTVIRELLAEALQVHEQHGKKR
jgi:hypothetical protein